MAAILERHGRRHAALPFYIAAQTVGIRAHGTEHTDTACPTQSA